MCGNYTVDAIYGFFDHGIFCIIEHNHLETLDPTMVTPLVSITFRHSTKCLNDFHYSGPGWLICTANSLATFLTPGPTFVVYHIIWTMNDLHCSMSIVYLSLLSPKFVLGAPGVLWNLMLLSVNLSYPPTNLLTSFSMVICAYRPLSQWPNL